MSAFFFVRIKADPQLPTQERSFELIKWKIKAAGQLPPRLRSFADVVIIRQKQSLNKADLRGRN
jgi:hypothetical protein